MNPFDWRDLLMEADRLEEAGDTRSALYRHAGEHKRVLAEADALARRADGLREEAERTRAYVQCENCGALQDGTCPGHDETGWLLVLCHYNCHQFWYCPAHAGGVEKHTGGVPYSVRCPDDI